ncbi:MAG: hypothetical protein WC580_10220 [Agrococcus sp.]
MHYLLGLAALVMGAAIATRRTRPTWFVVLTGVLVGLGALLAILSYTRVTDSLGLLPNSIIGWTFVGLSIITMLSSIFVLERRGEHGEELPPLIGDNPFDGDTEDSDDPTIGGARVTTQDGVFGSDADVMAGDASAPIAADGVAVLQAAMQEPQTTGRTAASHHTEGSMTDSTTPTGGHGDEHEHDAPRPQDGTAVVGTDPDIATSDQDAALRAERDDEQGERQER